MLTELKSSRIVCVGTKELLCPLQSFVLTPSKYSTQTAQTLHTALGWPGSCFALLQTD